MLILLVSCSQHEHDVGRPVNRAVAVLRSIGGSPVTGTVSFTRRGTAISIETHVFGLEPGDHGFHIHEYGDLSTPDRSSAGGHFNPMGVVHGGRTATVRHVGDLGNLTADETGHAMAMFVDQQVSLRSPRVRDRPGSYEGQNQGLQGFRPATIVVSTSRGGKEYARHSVDGRFDRVPPPWHNRVTSDHAGCSGSRDRRRTCRW
ncbi:superoxide dismutase family protein [Candidatus Neomarinimicrobiota bacterium]